MKQTDQLILLPRLSIRYFYYNALWLLEDVTVFSTPLGTEGMIFFQFYILYASINLVLSLQEVLNKSLQNCTKNF